MSGQRNRGHSWIGVRASLSRSLRQMEVDPKDSVDLAGLCWALAVGREIAAFTQVIKVAPKTLTVEVAGQEWIPSLEALRDKIIREMKQQAGLEGLTRIIFSVTPARNCPGGQISMSEGN